jgi:uncharacterized protein
MNYFKRVIDDKKGRIVQILLLAFFGFLIFLLLDAGIRKYIILNEIENELRKNFLSKIITRACIIVLALYILRRSGLLSINGISKKFEVKNLQAFIIVLVIIFLIGYGNRYVYLRTPSILLILFILQSLFVGTAEELILRGIVQPLAIKLWLGNKNGITWGVLGASVIFGLLHLLNLIKHPDEIEGVLYQTFLAICVGIFLGGLLVRTGNILPICIIHGLLNFAFGPTELKAYLNIQSFQDNASNSEILSLVITSLIGLFIALSGLYMIKISNKQDYMEKVSCIEV